MVNAGKKLQFRRSDKGGWEWSDDGGKMWYFTFRGRDEILEMWPDAIETSDTVSEVEEDREVFGDTLDEPIPDDLWEMIESI